MEHVDRFTHESRIAYFSMEIALQADVPTYAGGLGVLAGDMVRSAADLEVPLVAVTLVSRNGYFRQELDAQGRQIEQPERWHPEKHATRMSAGVAVPIEGRDVWVSAWLYVVSGQTGGQVPVILLDTDLPFNAADDRAITDRLYGGDATYRIKQETVLGIAGFRMLRALGFNILKYHMNEGHSALLVAGAHAPLRLSGRTRAPRRARLRRSTRARHVRVHHAYPCRRRPRQVPVRDGQPDSWRICRCGHVEGTGRHAGAQHDEARPQPQRVRERRRAEPCRGHRPFVPRPTRALDNKRSACLHLDRRELCGALRRMDSGLAPRTAAAAARRSHPGRGGLGRA